MSFAQTLRNTTSQKNTNAELEELVREKFSYITLRREYLLKAAKENPKVHFSKVLFTSQFEDKCSSEKALEIVQRLFTPPDDLIYTIKNGDIVISWEKVEEEIVKKEEKEKVFPDACPDVDDLK